MVMVNAPAVTGDGVTDEMPGNGMIVTEALPLAAGVVVLVARTVTTDGVGTSDGAM